MAGGKDSLGVGIQAIDGAFWNVGLALANKLVTLAGQVALAWFLVPADMGLANLALATVAFTAVLSVGGLGDVLLQRRRYAAEAGQAFWLSLGFSLLMGLAIVALALLSPAMGRPGIKGLMLVLAVNVVWASPATVLSAGLKDKLDFKGLAMCQMLGGFFYTVLAVFLAWLGWGPYALIVPMLAQQGITMGAMLAMGSRPPWTRPDGGVLKVLLKPTLALSLTGLFVGLQSQVPVFVCGGALDAAALGHFSWGWAVAGQAVFLLAMNLREILLPAFTKLQDDPRRRAERAMKAARAITATLCVVCGAQALLARPLITLLLPAKWIPAIPVVVCASLGMAAMGLWISGMAWLNACAKYRTLLKMSVFQTCVSAISTWIGLRLGGLDGAGCGCAVAVALGALVCVLPMGSGVLLNALSSWWKPLGLSILFWGLCFAFSWGRLSREIGSALAFSALTAWLWWREDDGGLAGIFSRGRGILARARPLIGLAP